MGHQPVLLSEALAWLGLGNDPSANAQPHAPRISWWADLTVGGGGHTEAILQATAPLGKVLGLDQDEEVLTRTRERLAVYQDRLKLVKANFKDLRQIVQEQNLGKLCGVVMDLGVSSFQLDEAERGFSFSQPGPLDMRMDRKQSLTAADLINQADEEELARIFYLYGEEHRSRRLAKAIVRQRPLRDTLHLAQTVEKALGRRGRIHPATRVFQALRIVVNDELNNLSAGLEAAAECLQPDGRLAVISFHSLEDRIVKQSLKKVDWKILTKHVVRPQLSEIRGNPRSRSARLRAAARMSPRG